MIINYLNGIKIKLWDTQRNIEEDGKSAQKREEVEEEIRKGKPATNGINNSNQKVEFVDIYNSFCSYKSLPVHFC